MSRAGLLRLLASAACLATAPAAHAHFVLNAPASFQEQDPNGDPQKAGPCGDPGTKTGKVTTLHAGDTVHIDVDEMVPHGGHYRVALGLKGAADLPADPKVVTKAGVSVSAPIENPAVFPVLADGVNVHDAGAIMPGHKWTWDVKLPAGMTCTGCVLQVTEFMTDHGSNTGGNDGYFYHHCADIEIRPAAVPDAAAPPPADAAVDAGKSVDARSAVDATVPIARDAASAETGGSAGLGGASGSGGAVGMGGSGGSAGGTSGGSGDEGDAGSGGSPARRSGSSGCALGGGAGGGALTLLALALLASRRRR